MGNSGAFVPVFPLLPPVVNREFPDVPHNLPPHPARPPTVPSPDAVGGVRATASFWPVFPVDRSNSDYSSTRRTQEKPLSLWAGLSDIAFPAHRAGRERHGLSISGSVGKADDFTLWWWTGLKLIAYAR